MSEEDEEQQKIHSRFREFLIPDAKNTLESAANRHERGDFDRAESLLYLAKDKIDRCIAQLQDDRREWESENQEKEEDE